MGSGFEQMSVAEIKDELVHKFFVSPTEVLDLKGKAACVEALKKAMAESTEVPEVDNLADLLNVVNPTGLLDAVAKTEYPEGEEPEVEPEFGQEGWTDYVLKELKDDEKVNGQPTTDGLRRLVELFIGPIVGGESKIVQWPRLEDNFRAACEHRVTIESRIHNRDIVFTEVSEVSKANTDDKFFIFACATAATRAEGRALRKALKLKKVLTAEETAPKISTELSEKMEEEFNPNRMASKTQVMVLDMISQRQNLDAWAIIQAGSVQYNNLNEIPYSKMANEIIKYFNTLQFVDDKGDVKEIPEKFLGYKTEFIQNHWIETSSGQ